MLTNQTGLSHSASLSAQQRVATGMIALIFGAFLVFGAGFAHSDTLHNAAHDTRHALGFPCH
jgi:cobalt transporter subunit CbtB